MEQKRAKKEQNKSKSFKNGKIYVIRNSVDDKKYVGSTCKRYESQRYQKHISSYKMFLNGYKKKMSRLLYEHMQKIGVEHFFIELIENYPCDNLDELRRREGYWQRLLKSELNIYMAGRTHKEHYKEYKDEYKQRQKEYSEKNKDKIVQHKKEYYVNNKDNIVEKSKKRYTEKKEDLNQPFMCECGLKFTASHYERHCKSTYHQKYLTWGGIDEINNKELICLEQKEKRKAYLKVYDKTDKRKQYRKQYEKCEKRKLYQKEYDRINRYCKVLCDCGCISSVKDLPRHKKSQYHISHEMFGGLDLINL